MNTNICLDAVPSFLKFFDISVAPPLLFYAYIPAIVAALFFGFYIFKKDNHSLQSKLLLGIAVSFSIWVLNLIFQWTIAYVNIDMFSWQITPFFEILIPILSIYFAYVFLNKKDIPLSTKIIFSFFVFTLAITIPTKFNTLSFDYLNCQANYGDVYYHFVYIFELLTIFIVDYICIKKFLETPKEELAMKQQAVILAVGSTIFLSIFFLSNILGEFTKTYQINLFGPIGILVFIGFMTFMIVRYGLFHMKLIATQALVLGISILIGSQLFSPSNIGDEIITALTLIAFLVAGFYLIRSVKSEIEAKEALKIINEKQQETMSFITHQIRGVFTTTKAGLSTVIEGSYGPVPPKIMEVMDHMFKSQEEGVNEVQTFLQTQKIESGTVQYGHKPFDLKALVEEDSAKEKTRAESKGLQYEVQIDNGDFTIEGDKVYLKQVIDNLIDNAIRYTEKGSVKIQLSRKTDTVLYSVKDSGVGIKEEDKKKMFIKYGSGAESRKINPDTKGLGLYFVKIIVVGCGGRIWYETEVGKGTTFFVELPVSGSKKK